MRVLKDCEQKIQDKTIQGQDIHDKNLQKISLARPFFFSKFLVLEKVCSKGRGCKVCFFGSYFPNNELTTKMLK